MNSFVFVFFAFFSCLAFSKTYQVDLELAEKMAIKKTESRSIYKKEWQKKTLKSVEKNLSLLPSLSTSYSLSSPLEGPLKHNFFFSVQQKIPNPVQWYYEKKSLLLDERISLEEEKEEVLEALEELRKTFFKSLILKKKLSNSKENFLLASELLKETSLRYKSGSASLSSLRRAKINEHRIKSSLSSLESDEVKVQDKLKIMLGLSSSDRVESPLGYKIDLSLFENKNFNLNHLSSQSLLIKDLSYQKASYQKKSSSFFYLPEPSLEARYSLKSKFSFQVTLNWKIFSGGSDFYRYKRDFLEQEIKSLDFMNEEEKIKLKLKEKVESLSSLKEEYGLELSILDEAKEILNSSRERLKDGELSSQDFSADFKLYIDQENRVLDLEFNIFSLVFEISRFSSKKNFFYSYISFNSI